MRILNGYYSFIFRVIIWFMEIVRISMAMFVIFFLKFITDGQILDKFLFCSLVNLSLAVQRKKNL